MNARPFLKWAGGKTRLLPQLARHFPPALHTGHITQYVEPFIGGGALLFYLAAHFRLERYYICDVNLELVRCYQTVQGACEELIARLDALQAAYHQTAPAERAAFYYTMRASFNAVGPSAAHQPIDAATVERTAQLIYLNRTCYNGLFRLNRQGAFNVPFGRYATPRICDAPNLRAAAQVLRRTCIEHRPYATCAPNADPHTLVYFDPPYRPLSRTASFTSYAREAFTDDDQRQLAQRFRALHAAGAHLMLSNADPANTNSADRFFDELYAGFTIHRLTARRAINTRSDRRGPVSELLITNY